MTTPTVTFIGGLLPLLTGALSQPQGAVRTMLASEIHMRDPFIMPYEGTYYLVGTTGDAWGKGGGGFEGYSSSDLIHWTSHGPILQFDDPPTWAAYHFWAPELYARGGRFYLCYSGKSDRTHRGTGIAVGDSPRGPFRNLSDRPLTPVEWECLDGHLFRDADGTEWLIYVHEWVQCEVGEMWAQRVSDDYTRLVGERHYLFRGTQASWSNHVIDGPMMVLEGGEYHLFWSSFNARDGYCTGVATAESLLGPYTQSAQPIIAADGGHNGVFRGFDGKCYTSFHRPNRTPDERVAIHELLYADGAWRLGRPIEP
ncbi:MAG: glycoside hydrolase [Armatimonadetes bacterium]|nr:glycoside hydrolase [Armatimonadota bacterium]